MRPSMMGELWVQPWSRTSESLELQYCSRLPTFTSRASQCILHVGRSWKMFKGWNLNSVQPSWMFWFLFGLLVSLISLLRTSATSPERRTCSPLVAGTTLDLVITGHHYRSRLWMSPKTCSYQNPPNGGCHWHASSRAHCCTYVATECGQFL